MNSEELRSIQWLLPELADGVFEQADLRHFQQIFRGSVTAGSDLTQNQLWSIQQMFPTDGLDIDDLLHYQLLFRVEFTVVATSPSRGLQFTLSENKLHYFLGYED